MSVRSIQNFWTKAVFRSLFAIPLLLLSLGIVRAEILSPMEPQALEPGALLSYPIEFNSLAGQRVELKLENSPEDARLSVDTEGRLMILWESPSVLPSEVHINLVARNIDSGKKLESRVLIIRAAGPTPTDIPTGVSLGPFDEQALMAGDVWEWIFNIDPTEIQLSAGGLPPGAMFLHDHNNGYVLRWTPETVQQGRYQVSLMAVDRRERSRTGTANMLLEVVPKPVEDTFVNPDTPTIPPLANQVVSAGRIVSFKVTPEAEDGTVPVLLVDRIPRDASFDGNEDGSRTFFWQTGDRDQGEHVFRFTAVNPREPNLRTFRDVLIIVGDPSRNKTAPQ